MPSHRTVCLERRPLPGLLAAATLLAWILLTSVPFAARGQTQAAPAEAAGAAPQVVAERLQGPVRLDGVLDELDWQRPSALPLVQNDPINGAAPRQRTDWWVGYDDEALYVAARLHDAAPESISARLGRRDNRPDSDFLTLCLDTFDDNRSAFMFSVNAAGAIKDATVYNEDFEDISWDGVWDWATRIDDRGWAAELRIPFSQLSFPERPEQVWGINLTRRLLRFQERDDLFLRPRGEAGYVSRFPDLVGLRGVHAGRHLEVLAYGATRVARTEVDDADPFHDGSDLNGDAGVDLAWGLSSSLSLNATVNPDFGQVEVDPAVVNLKDSEIAFEEKRPFFVRGANAFRFGREGINWGANFNWMDPTLFYSRRVGRAPQVSCPGGEFLDTPRETTILGAAKVGGTVGGLTVAGLAAATAREEADLYAAGRRWSQVVEPGTGYGVLRLKSASADGRRGLGLMTTHVQRDLEDHLSPLELLRSAHVAGLDGWLALDSRGVWALKGYLSASRVAGEAAAVDALQRSSVRYLHRPGLDHFAYDPERTSLSGWTGRAVVNKQSGSFMFNTALGAISPGYEINDLGYQTRADVMNWHLVAGYRWQEPNRTFRSRDFRVGAYRAWDLGGHPDDCGYAFLSEVTFANYWLLGSDIFYSPERYHLRVTRGGPVMRIPAMHEGTLYFASDSRRSVIVEGQGTRSHAEDGTRMASGEVSLTVRPRAALRITVGPSLQWYRDPAMWVANVTDPGMTATSGVRHVFGDIEYREFSMATRIDWTFTPRLTLQSYLQPLLASGRYTRLKEFARPHSYDFNMYGESGSTIEPIADAAAYRIDPDGAGPLPDFTLADPDFNYKSLKVNLVLRWEYRPGSTAYLVWTQDRLNLDDPGDFRLGRDTRSLLDAPGDDIVMLKVTTWLDL